ncbi:hypothetical protein AMTRI_Chr07g25180 [Amborella trichopoda]
MLKHPPRHTPPPPPPAPRPPPSHPALLCLSLSPNTFPLSQNISLFLIFLFATFSVFRLSYFVFLNHALHYLVKPMTMSINLAISRLSFKSANNKSGNRKKERFHTVGTIRYIREQWWDPCNRNLKLHLLETTRQFLSVQLAWTLTVMIRHIVMINTILWFLNIHIPITRRLWFCRRPLIQWGGTIIVRFPCVRRIRASRWYTFRFF